MERRIFLKIGTGAALGGALAACGGGGHGSGGGITPPPPEPVRTRVALGWNTVARDAIRALRLPPPLAARALAIVHTAMYDAWAAYDPVALGTRHGATLRRPVAEQTLANQVRAFSYAAYAALLDQFPSQKAAFDGAMAALAYRLADADGAVTTPAGLGTLAARSVIAYRHADGANQLGNLSASGLAFADYTGYVSRNTPLIVAQATPAGAIADPNHWQPLLYRDAGGVLRTQAYLLPFWGQVKPFALTGGSQFRPGPPATLGSAAFLDQAVHVVQAVCNLTETQKVMADFWAGGTAGELPSGYWMQFAQLVSARDGNNEGADIKLFFALSNALLDAGIAAWDAKRNYDSARPITAIRHLLCDTLTVGYGFDGPAGSLRQITGASWVPYHLPTAPTPPFAEHVSGHSTYSAASATVLRLFTGSDAFGHSVTVAPGAMLFDPRLPAGPVKLSWDTFSSAAREAGASRILAGIHFPNADVAGRSLGEQVGAAVFAQAQRYWLGTT
jgi:hypothetical protein